MKLGFRVRKGKNQWTNVEINYINLEKVDLVNEIKVKDIFDDCLELI